MRINIHHRPQWRAYQDKLKREAKRARYKKKLILAGGVVCGVILIALAGIWLSSQMNPAVTAAPTIEKQPRKPEGFSDKKVAAILSPVGGNGFVWAEEVELEVTTLVSDYIGEIYVDMEVIPVLAGEKLYSGMYARTVPGTEKAARDELPISVYRPGMIVGHSRSGAIRTFNTLYYPLRLYLTGRLRVLPARRGLRVNLVPVDYVAEAIARLSDGVPDRLVPAATEAADLIARRFAVV